MASRVPSVHDSVAEATAPLRVVRSPELRTSSPPMTPGSPNEPGLRARSHLGRQNVGTAEIAIPPRRDNGARSYTTAMVAGRCRCSHHEPPDRVEQRPVVDLIAFRRDRVRAVMRRKGHGRFVRGPFETTWRWCHQGTCRVCRQAEAGLRVVAAGVDCLTLTNAKLQTPEPACRRLVAVRPADGVVTS